MTGRTCTTSGVSGRAPPAAPPPGRARCRPPRVGRAAG
jgi:hypothetical protein